MKFLTSPGHGSMQTVYTSVRITKTPNRYPPAPAARTVRVVDTETFGDTTHTHAHWEHATAAAASFFVGISSANGTKLERCSAVRTLALSQPKKNCGTEVDVDVYVDMVESARPR